MIQAGKNISLALFVCVSVANAGANSATLDASDVEVEQAFRDQAGNLVIRLKYGAVSIGTNLMFWGPCASGKLYQMEEKEFSGSNLNFTSTFFAPSVTNPARRGQVRIEENGDLRISCGDAAECFNRVSKTGTAALTKKLRSEKLLLESIPDLRAIEYSFKVEGSETYVIVDSPRLRPSYDFAVFIGEKGNLLPHPVAHVSRRRDGGTTDIILADGRKIYAPSPFKNGESAHLFAAGHRQRLIPQSVAVEFATSLGLEESRFRVSEVKTPITGPERCSAFLSLDE